MHQCGMQQFMQDNPADFIQRTGIYELGVVPNISVIGAGCWDTFIKAMFHKQPQRS
jgi:hypothetical protein